MEDSLIAVRDERTGRHGDRKNSPRHRIPVSPCPRVILLPILLLMIALSGCTAQVRVEWSTETEMDTAGFNLYRGESADGPFDVKVNDQLIPPAADPMTGGEYEFVDKTARPGVIYYYQLEEVERNGATNSFGPISTRAGGLGWWHILVLVLLGGGAAALWIFGRKRAMESSSRSGNDLHRL